MKLRHEDYKTHTYLSHELPEGNYKTYSSDMSEIVNCVQCGKPITLGEGYASREVHTDMGLGYVVCSSCYDGEFYRRQHDGGHE